MSQSSRKEVPGGQSKGGCQPLMARDEGKLRGVPGCAPMGVGGEEKAGWSNWFWGGMRGELDAPFLPSPAL